MRVPLTHRQLSASNQLGELIRQDLHKCGVYALTFIGGPGCGKTSIIDASIDRGPDLQIGVISGDLQTTRDAQRISTHTRHVVPVQTGQESYLHAGHIRDALHHLALTQIHLLMIENVGSLNDPADRDLGEDAIVAVFSVSEGDDKAQKHQDLVRAADVVLLNKVDLVQAVPFSVESFRRDVHRINAAAELFEVSALQGIGMDPWLAWLRSRVQVQVSADTSTWFGCI